MTATGRLAISLSVLGAAFLLLPDAFRAGARVLIAWNAAVVVHLLIVAYSIAGKDAAHVRAHAQRVGSTRGRVVGGVVLVCLASLVAVVAVLNGIKRPEASFRFHLLLCLATVFSSWVLLQVTFALYYARYYYQTTDGSDTIAGGLRFPGDEPPDYVDFIYFSCVIGTSYSTSDTDIESRVLRRAVLIQSIVGFLFYTVLIGLVMNAIGALF